MFLSMGKRYLSIFFAQLHCMVSRTADSGELGNQELVLQLSVLNLIKEDKDDNFTTSAL